MLPGLQGFIWLNSMESVKELFDLRNLQGTLHLVRTDEIQWWEQSYIYEV